MKKESVLGMAWQRANRNGLRLSSFLLDATLHLYMRVCLSIDGWMVRWSVDCFFYVPKKKDFLHENHEGGRDVALAGLQA